MAASRSRVDGILLTASLATMGVVVPSGVQFTFIEITLHNTDTVARLVDVHFIKTGGAAGDLNKIIGHVSGNQLEAGETRIYPFQPILGVGDFIQAKADVTNKVSFSAGILRESV
jgi:hypothetical protein